MADGQVACKWKFYVCQGRTYHHKYHSWF